MVGTPESLWSQAAALQRAGRAAEAVSVYRQFIALRPDVVEARVNLASLLAVMGAHTDAEGAYRQAIALRRDLPAARFGLANVLRSQGRLEEAVAAYRAGLALDAGNAGAIYNLGSALQALGQTDQAFTAFSRAVALKPDFAQAHNNLGILHYDRDEWEQAVTCFIAALRLQPGFFKARNNLGMTMHKLGRLTEAEAAFREATRLKPDYVESFDNLATLLLEMGRTREAFECFMRRAALVTDALPQDESRKPHDLEQAAFRGRAATVVEIDGGARLSGPAVNRGNDIQQASTAWRDSHPQIVVIDDLLTTEALEALRRFCHGSTIWRDTFDGYVGARPQSGFACPLLAQVACELAEAHPAIFEGHPLLFAWAFKYQQGMSGTRAHADFAAVNVNFWITPDDANLDPETGGLVIWDKAAPLDWDFDRYNADEAMIRDFLARSGAQPTRIPYRANRAVVFDSDLFHETDTLAFHPGYTNRRINITLLYGTRDAPGKRIEHPA
ncbi:MAG TPA: tetratricopeptide repeat protein [Rhizomicrobium sp.]|jgi:tetratricopeptide (TPR) repeat protein|nr:tetratricopeptide repeat protein [Rhizomicrobium sp.]